MANNLNPYIQHFHPADYAVFIIVLLISLLIGFYFAFTGGRQKTVQEYFLGDRQMGVLPIAVSLLASFLSAVTMIGTPTEIYMYGLVGACMVIGTLICLPIVSSCFLPTFYNIGLTSINEYIELRFDKNLRKVSFGLFLCYMIIYVSFVLYTPALALSQVTGLHLWLCIATVGVLGTIYTALGGIKAVMWTDVFQFCVMIITLCVVAFKGAMDVGGFSYVFSRAAEGKRLVLPSWSVDFRIRYTVWNIAFGTTLSWMAVYGTNQTQVQRYLTSPTLKAAKRTLLWNALGVLLFYTLIGICGLNVYAKYWDCDPATYKLVNAYDQVFPLFIMETFNNLPGLSGLFVAGVFCGSMSTISSAFNAMAATTLEDFVKAFDRWKNLSSEKSATVSKILAASYGCICLLIVAAISQLDSNITQGFKYNTGVFDSSILGFFILGMFFPWSNRSGAYVGLIFGVAFSLWVSVNTQMQNKPFTPRAPYTVDGCEAKYGHKSLTFNVTTETWAVPSTLATMQCIGNSSAVLGSSENREEVVGLYQIAFMWLPMLTTSSVVIIGAVTSLLTGPTKLDELDLRLLCPFIQTLVKKYHKRKGIRPNALSEEPNDEVLQSYEIRRPLAIIGAKTENDILV